MAAPINNPATITGTATGAVTEDGGLIANNTADPLIVHDIDNGDDKFGVAHALTGTYGTFTFKKNTGVWGYTLNNAAANVQALAGGATATDTLLVTSKDGSASQTITVTITGTNDAASISGTATGSVTEDGILTAGNTLAVSDVDTGENKFQSPANLAGTYGTFIFNANTGVWGYTLSNAALIVQALDSGASVTDTLLVKSLDGTASQTITVTVHGAYDGGNSLPVIGGTSTASVTEDTAAQLTAGSSLTITDADAGQYSFTAQGSAAGTYGTFTLAANGDWTYKADNSQAAIQQLGVGQSITDSFVAFSNDGSASQTVTVTINGANDAPAAHAASFSVAEDAATVNGSVSATDVDANAVLGFALNGAAPAGLSFNANGSYSFDPSNAAYQSLGVGQSTQLTVPYTVTDDQGATSSANLVITVTGTNDIPVANAASFSVAEDAATVNGSVTATDADANAVLGFALNGAAPAGLSFNANGSYSFDPSNAAYQSLGVGQSTQLTVPYTVTDDQGASSGANLVITVTGTYDGPVANAASFAVAEDAATVNGSVSATDVDANAVLGFALNGAAPAGLSFNADGSYSFDPSNAAYQSLGVGQSTQLTVPFTVTNGQGASSSANLAITVTGTNDAPVGVHDTGDATAAGTAAGSDAIGNVLTNDTDVDAGDTKAVSAVSGGTVGVALAGSYGSLTLNADGSYSYAVSTANSTVDALGQGGTLTDTFSYTMRDAAGATGTATLTVTIHGANDAPHAVGDVASATEAGTGSPGSGASGNVLANDSDIDTGDSVTVNAIAGGSVGAAHAGSYGSLTLNANGSYSYVVDDANATVDALGPTGTLTDTFTYTIVDSHGATASADLVVTIHGADDAPTGGITIGGVGTSGNLLTALNTLADPEGLGTLHYLWRADGLGIVGANDAATFMLTNAQAGKVISVVVSYTDGGGTVESAIGTMATAITSNIILGGIRPDHLIGTSGNDIIDGLGAGDTMEGGQGDDIYYVNDARDVVIERPGEGTDLVIATVSYTLGANQENLTLGGTGSYFGRGNELDNVIVGNGANNVLTGFGGVDTLTGGGGADVFTFVDGDTPVGSPDVVTDFNAAQNDKIDLRQIDARWDMSGNQAFRFIGTAQFSANAAGELRFDAATHMLLGSTDADFHPEIAIVLVGVNSISAANIML